MKRLVSLTALVLSVVLMMTGCSSGGGSTAASSVKITVAVPYVLEGAGDEFKAQLEQGLPELNTEEKKLSVQWFNTGDTKSDPMSAMAGMTKITTMLMGNEIEIMICDADNAQRHGEGGSTYMPLSQLFTAEEQAELGIVPLTVSKVDADGNVTGEQSEPIGISLENCDGVKNIFKMKDMGLYVIGTPETEANIENIRTAVRYILSM